MKHAFSLAALALSGCLGVARELPPPVEVLGVSPSEEVDPLAAVTVAFSQPVRPEEVWPISVQDEDGASMEVVMTPYAAAVELAPALRWPEGTVLFVVVGEGLLDDEGRPVAGARLPFNTKGGAPVDPDPAVVRSPTPGTEAPLNLAFVTVGLTGDPTDLTAYLEDETQQVPMELDRAGERTVRFSLPPHQDACRPLCPGARYRVVVSGVPVAEGTRGEVITGTVTDERPPEIVATKVFFRGGQPVVEVCADEPVYAVGEAIGPEGESILLLAEPLAAERVRLRPARPLDPSAPHELRVEVRDAAGLGPDPITVPLVTPPEVVVTITEVVAAPLRDWSDSEGGGTPFDPVPGVGAVTETDEWVELVNQSESAIDLFTSGLELRAIDGTPSVTPLAGAPGLYFGDGGDARTWRPGEALVVRPRGAMSSRDLEVEVAVGDRILDRVVLGPDPGSDHPGGSPPGVHLESVARTGEGTFAWCVPTPGDPLPASVCGR